MLGSVENLLTNLRFARRHRLKPASLFAGLAFPVRDVPLAS